MADLVRVRLNGVEKNVGRAFAEANDLEVLDESAYSAAGRPRRTTRVGGRPRKPHTSVAELVAEKKKATPVSTEKAVTPASNERE